MESRQTVLTRCQRRPPSDSASVGSTHPPAKRASAVIKILRREGPAEGRAREVQDLIGILKRRWDPTKMLKAIDHEVQGVFVAAGETPSSLVAEMVTVVEQSFDYKETGSQYRLGVNYNFMTGETESDVQPLLLAASYTEVFGDERLIIQPYAYFYKRIDEDEDASYGASIDVRYAKSASGSSSQTDGHQTSRTPSRPDGATHCLRS